MSWHKLELQNKELFGPTLNVVEKDGIFQFQTNGARRYIQISKDEAIKLRKWLGDRFADNTADQMQSFAQSFDKCRGR